MSEMSIVWYYLPQIITKWNNRILLCAHDQHSFFSPFLKQKYVRGAEMNRLNETVPFEHPKHMYRRGKERKRKRKKNNNNHHNNMYMH